MNQQYRFFIRLGESGQQQAVTPVWKDDLALEYQKERGQMFYRSELSSALDFIGADYTLITGAAFDTAFFVDIERSINGTAWLAYWTGRFYMTDCTVNVDDQRVTVKPSVYDRYNAILEGMEKEYDLIKLAPAIQPVTVIRRPVLQVYTLGEDKLTNILSTMSWEQDCSAVDSRTELSDLHFGELGTAQELDFSSSTPGLTTPFTGSYTGHGNETGEWMAYTNSEGIYRITYFQRIEINTLNPQFTYFINGLRIYGYADNVLYWEFEQSVGRWPSIDWYFEDIPDTVTFSPVDSGVSTEVATWTGVNVFGRLVMAVDTYQGQQCYEIPADDIVSTNRNFRYCMPYSYGNVLVQSSSYQADPTEWGVRPDGNYYVQPSGEAGVNRYIPVGRSFWQQVSAWVKVDGTMTGLELAGRKETEIRDAFALDACISALLGQVDPSLSFGATATYSQFLYSANNPVWTSGTWGRLFVTPKSNVLVAEYTQPARKALCTLKDFLDMLRIACGLYWFIDDNNRLRIEHILWFKCGGSYSGSPTVGIDLTSMFNVRNNKRWSYGVNTYKFEKVDMAERYQFGWMDDATDVFTGFPIEVLSGYVQKGKIEEQTVGMFNADVDYMMTDPSNVSSDGFALLNCVSEGGQWKTQIATSWINSTYYTMQNWQMSFAWLQPVLLISDMPAWNIRVNGSDVTATMIQRKKTQEVMIPMPHQDGNMTQLVRTGIGDGEIKKMSIRLTSRMAKTTLAFYTE